MFDVIAAVIAMLEGLAFAHDRGLLHLDAKCDNVVFDSDRPYWIDWGLAEFIKRPDYLDAAPQDGSVGSPFFSSPQQYTRSRGWKSRSSDVYSVAAVMYCLVTGMPPWTREVHYAGKVTGEAAESSWIDWLGELTAAQPALISTTVSGFPPSLEPLSALLSRKLDKVAKNRQRSDSRPAAEFATELREILTTHRSALRLLPVGAETNTYLAELTPDERTALLQGHLSNAAQVSSVFDNNRPRPVIAKQPDRVGHAASRTVEPEPAHRRGVLRRVFRRDKSPAEETISAAESVPTWVSNVRPVRPVASESDATPVQDRPPPKGPGVVGTPADVTDAKTAGEDAEETVSGFIPEDEAIAAFEEEFEGQPTFEDLAANQAKKPAKPSVTPVIPGSELDLKSVRVARGPDGQEEYRVGDPVVIPDPDATEPDPTLSD